MQGKGCAILCFLLLCLSVFLLPFAAQAASFAEALHPIAPPRPVPPLVFEDDKNQQHALADFRGQFVLVNIWATWCAPCVKEMPALDALQIKMAPSHLSVLTLSEDRDPAAVSAFYARNHLKHLPLAIDAGGTAPSSLHLRGLPTTILINPQGQEIARIEGNVDWASPEAMAFLTGSMMRNSQ